MGVFVDTVVLVRSSFRFFLFFCFLCFFDPFCLDVKEASIRTTWCSPLHSTQHRIVYSTSLLTVNRMCLILYWMVRRRWWRWTLLFSSRKSQWRWGGHRWCWCLVGGHAFRVPCSHDVTWTISRPPLWRGYDHDFGQLKARNVALLSRLVKVCWFISAWAIWVVLRHH